MIRIFVVLSLVSLLPRANAFDARSTPFVLAVVEEDGRMTGKGYARARGKTPDEIRSRLAAISTESAKSVSLQGESPPPSDRSGPPTPSQAGLPKADSSDADIRLRLLCRVSYTEAVIDLSGIAAERKYDDRDLLIEVNKRAATVSIYGISDDMRSQHYVQASIAEYQISAVKLASKRERTMVQGIVLDRLKSTVRITSERWGDAGEHVSIVREYAGPCQVAKNGRSRFIGDEILAADESSSKKCVECSGR